MSAIGLRVNMIIWLSSFKAKGYPSISFAIFTKGNISSDFLVASVDNKSFLIETAFKGKNLLLYDKSPFLEGLSSCREANKKSQNFPI